MSASGAKEAILKQFELFSGGTGGIDSWLTSTTEDTVFDRLSKIDKEPLSRVQLNQLLILSHEADVSDGFFQYYWLGKPEHPYDPSKLPDYQATWNGATNILSLEHLRWGLYRFYVDALLFFGNIRRAYRVLRGRSHQDLLNFFGAHRFDTEAIRKRGPALELHRIQKDHRYLISEMACKSYGATPQTTSELKKALMDTYAAHKNAAGGKIKIRELLNGAFAKNTLSERQPEFLFSADDILDAVVESEADLEKKYEDLAKVFVAAREAALKNTSFYLSMVNDLDVYVATSMRDRDDFRGMANICETVFHHKMLKHLELRYFDPTLSAAEGHEDKGLIECLMVKCAKTLLYCAGKKESYGKDAEAAMALSLGKPVIFFCDEERRGRFYREVHPLSRLIDFNTGVPVGAMVTSSIEQVSILLYRLFENQMEYELDRTHSGSLRLKEKLTDSVVRLQTNSTLLRETFFNYYNRARRGQPGAIWPSLYL